MYVEILITVKIKDKEKGMAEDKKCCCKKKKERTDSEKKLLLKQIKKNRRPDKGNIWYG